MRRCIILFGVMAAITLYSKRYEVAPGGSISETIKKCYEFGKAGDTVFIKPGRYTEKILALDSIYIVGSGPESTIIEYGEGDAPTLTVTKKITTWIANLKLVYNGTGKPVIFTDSANFFGCSNCVIEGDYIGIVFHNSKDELDNVKIISKATAVLLEGGELKISQGEILDGATGIDVKGGTIDLSDITIKLAKQTGLWLHDGSKGKIENCYITNCGAYGVLVETRSDLTILNSKIEKSNNTGIYIKEGSKVIIKSSQILNSVKYGIMVKGGVVHVDSCVVEGNKYGVGFLGVSESSLKHSQILHNKKDGVYLKKAKNVKIESNVIKHNSNGIDGKTASAECINNLIARNEYYGVKIDGEGTFLLKNNTIAKNNFAGVSIIDNAVCNLVNNIIAFNKEWGIIAEAEGKLPGKPTLEYNCVYGNGSGEQYNYTSGVAHPKDINIDPKFIDPTKENFKLGSGSPCLNKGKGGEHIGAVIE